MVRYCECRLVTVPSVIGFVRPIVLLPMRALTGLSAEQLEAVIAHELGHVKRFDVAVNFFQVIAETLFFFHPAVWWLNKRIRADREDCCDDVAIAICGRNVSYARALATMEEWRDAPDLAMAATGSDVGNRVARLLGINARKSSARSAGVFTASLVLMAALMAGAASIGIANPALATAPFSQRVAQADVPAPAVHAPPAPERGSRAGCHSPSGRERPPGGEPQAGRGAQTSERSHAGRSAAWRLLHRQMKSAGFDNLDVDNLIALKVHEVTPEYVQSLRSAGFEPDAEEVIAMKSQDVTPEYIAQIRAMGFKPSADEVIAMKVHDITPEFVKAMRDMGMNPDAEEIIALKVHDITPEYRRSLEATGYKLSVEEMIEAKVMDVTPEFIKQARSHGFKDLTMQQIIQLKHAEVL